MASTELEIALAVLSENPAPTDAQLRKIQANCLVSIASSLDALVYYKHQEML